MTRRRRAPPRLRARRYRAVAARASEIGARLASSPTRRTITRLSTDLAVDLAAAVENSFLRSRKCRLFTRFRVGGLLCSSKARLVARRSDATFPIALQGREGADDNVSNGPRWAASQRESGPANRSTLHDATSLRSSARLAFDERLPNHRPKHGDARTPTSVSHQ